MFAEAAIMDLPNAIEVEVDAWQNERYKSIFGGWGAPIQTDALYFSDISGTIEVPFIVGPPGKFKCYCSLFNIIVILIAGCLISRSCRISRFPHSLFSASRGLAMG